MKIIHKLINAIVLTKLGSIAFGLYLKLSGKVITRFRIYAVFEKETRYVMKANSPLRMAGYVMGHFKNNGKPVNGWKLFLGSAATKKYFELGNTHFTIDGEGVTKELLAELDEMDSRWKDVEGDELEFENFKTNKKLRTSSYDLKNLNIEEMMRTMNQPKEEDLWTVLDEIFGAK